MDSDPVPWRGLLKSEKLWFGGAFAGALIRCRRRARLRLPHPNNLSFANPYIVLFKSRYLIRTRWINNPELKHLAFLAHGHSVVTCLLLSRSRIISASGDHSVHVYSLVTRLPFPFRPREQCVGPASTKDTLVSGSTIPQVGLSVFGTDRCSHVFGGHTSTIVVPCAA